jgi:spore maturation protein A
MIIAAIVLAIFTGKTQELSMAAMQSVKDAALMCLNLIGAYSLWLGILNIAKKSGLTEKISNGLSRIIVKLFNGVKKGSRAVSYIALNISANMLGMGNAATPFGIKAMQELQEINPDKTKASNAMCMLLVINSASVQLLPMTVVALRSAAGAQSPTDIILPSLFATAAACTVGVCTAKLLEKRKSKK